MRCEGMIVLLTDGKSPAELAVVPQKIGWLDVGGQHKG